MFRDRQDPSRAGAPTAASRQRAVRGGLLAVLVALAGVPAPAPASSLPELRIDVEARSAPGSAAGEAPPPTGVPGESGPARKLAAALQLGEETARAELELRAGPLPRSPGARPRIDVDMKQGARFFGLHRYSLLDPSAVGDQRGALLTQQLRRQGVLAPRIRFARVTLNGTALGVMAVRERLSKELLEAQQRRDGVLFRLRREDLPIARMHAYRAKKIAKSKRLQTLRDTAAGLLQAFLRGGLPAEEVFDVELIGRFLAVAELWRADALLRPENLRFYFNPITQRLEPVAHNGILKVRPDADARLLAAAGWSLQLLADDEVEAATRRNLQRLAGELAGSAFSALWTAEEARLLAALGGDGVEPESVDLAAWIARAGRLASGASVTERPSANHGDPSDRAALLADPEAPSLEHNPVPRVDLAGVLKRHPFLRWDAAHGALRAPPGIWSLRDSLVLPPGVGLDLVAGTTLRFPRTALLLATGPLRFRGSASAPVVLEGIPAGEGLAPWQGIAALDSGSPHVWEHVVVRGTTGIERGVWKLSAGITLRAAPVRMVSSTIRGNRTEDALNLIRSHFDLEGVSILDARSDAFDCDYCEGSVSGGSISRVGGDGIDVSGSDVQVIGVEFDEVRDKAISVGERSRLRARNLRIRAVGTAVAGKDGSEVIFEDSEVSDVRHIAIMAYTKKREYGPGRVSVRNIRMSRVARSAVAQLGSRIDIDGVAQVAEDVDIDRLYSQGYMKK